MATDSSRLSVQDIYSTVADILGKTVADGAETPLLPRAQFIRALNLAINKVTSESDAIERMALLMPNRNWLCYAKFTQEELQNGLVRIDLSGQSPVLQDATDYECQDWQYEALCRGYKLTFASMTTAPTIGSTLTQAVSVVYGRVREVDVTNNWVIVDQVRSTTYGNTFDTTNTVTGGGMVTAPSPAPPTAVDEIYGYGQDPDYAGQDASPGPATGPAKFPKIYLPAEANLQYTDYPPAGNADRIGGDNEPTTPFVVDMRKIGYGESDPDDDDYPTADDTHLYFIDPFLIYAMRLITYTVGAGTAINGLIPHSADDYLNTAWSTILNMTATSTGTAVAAGGPTFVIEGVIYTVTILNAAYDVAADTGFDVIITASTGDVFTYNVVPSETPWQTVAGSDRWGTWFDNQALYSNRAFYIKINDFVLKLPDDLRKIKWLWKIPTQSQYINIPEDEYRRIGFAVLTTGPSAGSTITQATTGATLEVSSYDTTLNYVYGKVTNGVFDTTNTVSGGGMVPVSHVPTSVTVHYLDDPTDIGDDEEYMFNKYDDTYHLFPLTESRFTQMKYIEAEGGSDWFSGSGYYLQLGQQLRIVPRPDDLSSAAYALLYDAKPDKISTTLALADFDTTWLELPNELCADAIIHLLVAGRYMSSRIGDTNKAQWHRAEAERLIEKAKMLYGGRQGQSVDGPALTMNVAPFQDEKYFGEETLGFGDTSNYRKDVKP